MNIIEFQQNFGTEDQCRQVKFARYAALYITQMTDGINAGAGSGRIVIGSAL
jgi:predicted GNAT superfamily acetyltransferase